MVLIYTFTQDFCLHQPMGFLDLFWSVPGLDTGAGMLRTSTAAASSQLDITVHLHSM